MKTLTHSSVIVDMDLLEENGSDRSVQSFCGGIKLFTKHLSPHILAVMLASVCLV